MPVNDLIYASDLAPLECQPECDCEHHHHHPHPCPPPPPPYPYPYPPYAWLVPPPPPAGYPFPPRPDDDDGQIDPDAKPSKVEKQICKLSRKAATLRTLIENLQDKNKDCIIKSGVVSYNLGPFKVKEDEEMVEVEAIGTIINILKTELEKVKEEIKELSDEIVVEED